MPILEPIIGLFLRFLIFLYETFFAPHCPQCEKVIKKSHDTCPHCGVNIKSELPVTEITARPTIHQKLAYVLRFGLYSSLTATGGIFLIGVISEIVVDVFAGATASPGSNSGAALIFFIFGIGGAIVILPVAAVVGILAGGVDIQKNKRNSKFRSLRNGTITGSIIAVISFIALLGILLYESGMF